MAILTSPVFAAEERILLVGTVLDPAGAAVPKARITLLSPHQSVLESALTDQEGRFLFAQVNAGSYVLQLNATGLAELRMPVRVQGTGTMEVTVRLQLLPLRTELTVTASPGSAESIDSVSQSVNVIEKDAIRQRTEEVLAQAAVEETGLALQRTSPTLAGVYVRGLTGNKVSMFLDGVRYTTSAQRGGINTFLDLTDPSAVQSIEVLRGPNSAQYGSDALGGSVQLLSQTPLPYSGRRGVNGTLETFFNSADLASGSNLAASFGLDRLTFQIDMAGRRVSTIRTGKEVDSHCAITRFLGLESDVLISDKLPDTAFTQYIHRTIEKQSIILPPGAVGTNLGGQPVIAQGPTGVVYVPAATNPVLVRANYGEAQICGVEQTLNWRIQDDLALSTILTYLRARNTRTDLPPDIEGGTPAPDAYLRLRYQRRNGRLWIEPFIHAAARQERLSSLDLEDRRTGAMRTRASIRRFFYNGAAVRGLVGPGPDGLPGNADDVLLPTGETLQQVQDRVLGPGVASAPLYNAVPGYFTLGLRAGIHLGEKQDCMIALANIGDTNYRGISWGLDAAGRSLSVRYRIGF